MTTHIRTISWVFCILCWTSGCSITSAYHDTKLSLLDSSSTAMENSSSAATGESKVDVSSAKFKIMHAYQFTISKRDGIDQEEAKIIAQSEVIFRGYDTTYYFTRPRIYAESPEIWAVEFFPVSKTFRDARNNPRIRITINKADGQLTWDLQS